MTPTAATELPTIMPNRNGSGPVGYDSVIPWYAFELEGITAGDTGHHYNYSRQRWIAGHDHAHVDAACRLAPLFCGSDFHTCQGA